MEEEDNYLFWWREGKKKPSYLYYLPTYLYKPIHIKVNEELYYY